MNGKTLHAFICAFALPILAYAKPPKANPQTVKIVCQFSDKKSGNYSIPLDFSNSEGLSNSEKLIGGWVRATLLVQGDKTRLHDGIKNSNLVWLLESPKEKLIEYCYGALAQKASLQTLYLSTLQAVQAYGEDSDTAKPRPAEPRPIVSEDGGHFYLAYREKTELLRKNLKKYNFAVVLPGMVYRSKNLGKKGIEKLFHHLEQERVPLPQSIASIHVMGFGGKGGSYNLEELEEAKQRGVTFLHSFAFDKKLSVYMDGIDPSGIAEDDPERGNIFREKTLDRFVPDLDVRRQLQIPESLVQDRRLRGDTMDFLISLENMIDAPWPILIHCKGGRHKTGVFCIFFEYLAYTCAMSPDLATTFVIPAYQSRLQLWWSHKHGSFWQAIFGGPWHESLQLYPAELHYAQHNVDIFREKNIDFARGLIDGRHLNTPDLRAQWDKVQAKFKAKAAHYPHFSKLNAAQRLNG